MNIFAMARVKELDGFISECLVKLVKKENEFYWEFISKDFDLFDFNFLINRVLYATAKLNKGDLFIFKEGDF